jgi:hypothetical protein
MAPRFIRVVTALILLSFAIPVLAVSPQDLYRELLNSKFQQLPGGFQSANVKAVPVHSGSGLIGEVDVILQETEPQTGFAYFVFSDFNTASEFNRSKLPPTLPGQTLLAYPPMARCADLPNGVGYCDIWVQDENVILATRAAKVSGGAADLMSVAFKNLTSIYERLNAQGHAAPAPTVTGSCALLSADEVANALHQQANPEADRIGGCNWVTNSADTITIQVPENGGSGYDNAKSRKSGITEISGIGDSAFGFTSLAGFVEIDFVKKDHYIVLIYANQRDSNREQTAKQLAAKIAARLN